VIKSFPADNILIKMSNFKPSTSNFFLALLILLSNAVLSQSFTWPTNSAENVDMDQQYIDAAIEQIESGTVGNIRSLIVIKDGQLITENYFGNSGEKRPVYSVTKSVGSALLGIAKYQGADINVVDSIMDYLPQYDNIPNIQQARNITLHNLLTQRHGYNWDEWSVPFNNPNNPVYQMLRSVDWYRFALQWPIIQAPDQNFTYSTGHSSLMSVILTNRTNRDVYEFAITELFQPLNITDTHWELIDGGGTQGQGLSQFPHNLEPLGYGLWLKPLDMAKIGELYRLGGSWQGHRLLSEEWITQSVISYSNGTTDADVFEDEYSGYGYQWWTSQLVDTLGRAFNMYYANGFGRQYILVIPEMNTVIVSTADDYTYEGPGIGTVMRENLLLAFANDANNHPPLTNDHNGSWYFPEHDGQGINFEVINDGNRVVGYWYTYDVEGGKQRWFTFQGDIINGVANFNLYSTSGGVFVDPQAVDVKVWGQGTLSINDCFTGLFTFRSNPEEVTEDVSGEFPLSRLTVSTGNCLNTTKSYPSMGHPYQLR
jgi:CubicO group peptidase (beta-lactamase class C family)